MPTRPRKWYQYPSTLLEKVDEMWATRQEIVLGPYPKTQVYGFKTNLYRQRAAFWKACETDEELRAGSLDRLDALRNLVVQLRPVEGDPSQMYLALTIHPLSDA